MHFTLASKHPKDRHVGGTERKKVHRDSYGGGKRGTVGGKSMLTRPLTRPKIGLQVVS